MRHRTLLASTLNRVTLLHMGMAHITVRLPDELLTALDDWRVRQEFPPTQSEAVRRAIMALVSFRNRNRKTS